MKSRVVPSASLIMFLGVLALATAVQAQTRSGLHFTQEEINIWRQRAQSGPYRAAGDASPNSPGDWTRIVNNRNAFASNPSNGRWSAPVTTGGCVVPQESTYGWPEPAHLIDTSWATRLRDAAFYNLVLGITTDHAAIKQELLWLAQQSWAQFGNPNGIWCFHKIYDIAPGVGVTGALSKVLFAYDYIGRSAFSQSELDLLDRWFFDAADFWIGDINKSIGELYANRASGNYTIVGHPTPCEDDPTVPFVGGAAITGTPAKYYNNRRNGQIAFVATAAVYLQKAGRNYTNGRQGSLADLIFWSKLYVQEFVRFSVFPGGYVGDFERREDWLPDLGWIYAFSAISPMLRIADVFARAGDPSLYNYNTALGACNSTGTINDGSARNGQNRDLRFAVESFLRYSTDLYARYWPSTGNQNNRIDGRNPRDGSSQAWAGDTWMALGNVFFKDAFIRQAYTRTHPGAVPYPASPSDGPVPWRGDMGVFPGVLFMFGQMEGAVNPYPTGGGKLPAINFVSDPSTIARGDSSTLTWSTSDATSCSASGGWSGTKAVSGTQNVSPTESTTYNLSCTGSGGSSSASLTVNVLLPVQSDSIAINAGGDSYTAPDGTKYEADIFFSGGDVYSTTSTIGNTALGIPYQSERYSRITEGIGEASYAIPLNNGDYTVTLQFAEIYFDAVGQRVFDVFVQGVRRITDLDIYAVAGKNNAYDITLPVTVTEGMLKIGFHSKVNNAKLSGLRITKSSSPPTSPTNLGLLVNP